MIRNPKIVGSFICYFWFMAVLSSQKFKIAKYRFWLQKGVKNWIRQDFLIRGLKLYVVSLLLLSQNLFTNGWTVWISFFLSSHYGVFFGMKRLFLLHFMQKRCQMKNYSFRLQKGIKNCMSNFFELTIKS